jgi:hypothetical protein
VHQREVVVVRSAAGPRGLFGAVGAIALVLGVARLVGDGHPFDAVLVVSGVALGLEALRGRVEVEGDEVRIVRSLRTVRLRRADVRAVVVSGLRAPGPVWLGVGRGTVATGVQGVQGRAGALAAALDVPVEEVDPLARWRRRFGPP